MKGSASSIQSNRLLGLALAVGALAVYLTTLSPGAFPGTSTALIAQHTGLNPFATYTNPLWNLLARGLRLLPFGSLAVRFNVLSAVCGAVSVWLLFRIVATWIYRILPDDPAHRRICVTTARLAGVAAALFLALCPAFWMVSTRAHTASFDILLLLSAVFLLLRATQRLSLPWLLLFAFVCGLGTAEFATFIVFLPLLAVYLGIALWAERALRPGLISAMLAAYLGGCLLYLLAAWLFMRTDAFAWREFTGFFHVLWVSLRDQYLLLRFSLPRVGWLLILILTVLPWITSLLISTRALNQGSDWASLILHLVMTALTVPVLLSLRLAPWQLARVQQFLITPYVLSASCFGYLVAYWYAMPALWWRGSPLRLKSAFGRISRPLTAAGMAALLIAAPFRSFPYVNARPAVAINAYAETLLDALDGRDWLIGDGYLDNHVAIAAYDRGRTVQLVSPSLSANEVYQRYVASLFDEPRLKSLAEVGILPLLLEWFKTTPDIESRAAVVGMPDLWFGAKRTAVPSLTCFLGVPDPAALDTQALLSAHQGFWDEVVPALQRARQHPDAPVGRLADHLIRVTGMVANNLGVLLEDLAQTNEAYRVYGRARDIDGSNISALLNQLVMLRRGFRSDDAESVQAALDKLVTGGQRYQTWALSRYYGYVRAPEVFVADGLRWASSGQPGLALSRLEQAVSLVPSYRDSLTKAVAGMFLQTGAGEQSEALYRQVLERTPRDVGALLGLARVRLAEGQFDQALELLDEAEAAGAVAPTLALERAMVYGQRGELDRARAVLQSLVETSPQSDLAWATLAALLQDEGDQAALNDHLHKMRRFAGRSFAVETVLGHIALARGDSEEAREHFELAHRLQPASVPLLELLLRLDYREAKPDLALQHARQLLRVDPQNPFGNHILASLQIRRREYGLAEGSLRRALVRQRSPDILNDLAWVLHNRRRYEAAEQLAREAVAKDETYYQAWDTLGTILRDLGRLPEAEEALRRALTLSPDDPNVLVHMVDVLLQRGDQARAAQLFDQLTPVEQYLDPSEQAAYAELRRRLRRAQP